MQNKHDRNNYYACYSYKLLLQFCYEVYTTFAKINVTLIYKVLHVFETRYFGGSTYQISLASPV